MDDQKQTLGKIVKKLFLAGITLTSIVLIYGAFIYWQTRTIEDPKKCFTTKMFKVNLCPGSESYVKYDDIPKHFFHALILSEDASFYSHKGFDWFEIKESFRRNFADWKFARGGSTLTQQLAKNLYLTSEKSISRKFKEIFISKQIEKRLSKTQILEKYANVVEFGKSIYGIKAASQYYFSKLPSQLNILESIYLVSVLPSPKKLSKSFNEKKLSTSNLWRMEVILKRLYRFKKIKDDLFVYVEMLLENNEWPFDEFNRDFYDVEKLSVEDEMFMELGEAPSEQEDIHEINTQPQSGDEGYIERPDDSYDGSVDEILPPEKIDGGNSAEKENIY